MPISPETLNAAFAEYLYTVPSRERLAEHIAEVGLTNDAAALTAELGAVIERCDDYLYDYPGGVPWSSTFVTEFRNRLQQAHPWLNDGSLARIMVYAQWLCWHDGLNATQ
jgi:hypothetical protein